MSLTVAGLRFARPNGFSLEVPELTFAEDRVTALLGPNGAGKTTLLRVIAGLEEAAAGAVRLAGAPLGRDALAFAFQERVFLDGTVGWNLELALRLRRVDPAGRAARIAEVAAELGIEHLLGRAAARLSGGEQQRVNLARTLALRAPLMLLDEPLASLDADVRARLLADLPAILRRYARIALVVTHDRREALALAEDLVILRDGRVLAAGAKRALFARPPDDATARALGLLVLAREGRRWAVAESDLTVDGPGPLVFDAVVERVLDLGDHAEVMARCGGAAVAIRAPADGPPPPLGAALRLTAARATELP